METVRRLLTTSFTLTLIFAALAYFTACSELPMQTAEENSEPVSAELAKLSSGDYPQLASLTLKLLRLIYDGGIMSVPNGSSFEVPKGSLIPPKSLLGGLLSRLLPGLVTLDMKVDLVRQVTFKGFEGRALIYTFGPSGSKFEPPAKAWIDFKDLGSPSVKIYYIDENNKATEIQPERIDLKNKRALVHIHHFSRYAAGWGESFSRD